MLLVSVPRAGDGARVLILFLRTAPWLCQAHILCDNHREFAPDLPPRTPDALEGGRQQPSNLLRQLIKLS